MKILIDHRERHLKPLFNEICEEVSFVQLPIGDYLLVSADGAVIVERKTVNDFIASIRSNRMWDQLLRMMTSEEVLGHEIKRRLLLLHGSFDHYMRKLGLSHDDSSKNWSQLMGACLEIIYVYNTPIIHAEDDVALRAFMKILMKREESKSNDGFPEARWYRKPARADLPKRDRKKYILSALPQIGPRLAENLLLHFKTISNVASASIEELQRVPKIGHKKAKLIHNMLH